MDLVILAGGFGTRISEESDSRPKPMVEIGERPIIWHIMKYYSCYGFTNFIICAGYKSFVLKEYFANYHLHTHNIRVNPMAREIYSLDANSEDWNISVIDTGLESMTGGRIKRIAKYLSGGTFAVTYGDGLSDVDLEQLQRHHAKTKAVVTLTAVRPEARFGKLTLDGDFCCGFQEKPLGDDSYINGGFFLVEPVIFNYLSSDRTIFESDTLPKLAQEGRLGSYRHDGFWQPMDTLRDRRLLENLWNSGRAPWKIWPN